MKYCGNENPIGGWVSYGYAQKEPAPQLVYEKTCEVPVRFVTIIAKEGVVKTTRLTELENGHAELHMESIHKIWKLAFMENDCSVTEVI